MLSLLAFGFSLLAFIAVIAQSIHIDHLESELSETQNKLRVAESRLEELFPTID